MLAMTWSGQRTSTGGGAPISTVTPFSSTAEMTCAATERNTRLALVRLDEGATFSAGLQSSIEILFLSKGVMTVAEKEHGERTAFEFQKGEGSVAIKALRPTAFLRIILTTF